MPCSMAPCNQRTSQAAARNRIVSRLPIPIPELESELNRLNAVTSGIGIESESSSFELKSGVGIVLYGIRFGIAIASQGIEIRYGILHILIDARPTVRVLRIN